MNIKDLKKEIPFKWRVQSFSKNKPAAICVAYIDARDVEDLLDEVCGPENWQVQYTEIGNRLMAGIAIKVKEEWVWKWDTGTETEVEKEKGEVSDSFKRAAVKWGVGRFLYRKEVKHVKANKIKCKRREDSETDTHSKWPYVVDDNGRKVWDLTAHINGTSSVQPEAQNAPVEPVKVESKVNTPTKENPVEIESTPDASQNINTELPAPPCPSCGGDVWDNRGNQKTPKSPLFTCKDKECKNEKGYTTSIFENQWEEIVANMDMPSEPSPEGDEVINVTDIPF